MTFNTKLTKSLLILRFFFFLILELWIRDGGFVIASTYIQLARVPGTVISTLHPPSNPKE